MLTPKWRDVDFASECSYVKVTEVTLTRFKLRNGYKFKETLNRTK